MELVLEKIILERGQRIIAAPISAKVKSGGYLAIRGPNGAGKSTLLRVIADLLQAKSGDIRLISQTGTDFAETAETPRREHIHYFGHLDGLKASMTARENLTFYERLFSTSQPRIKAGHPALTIYEALEAVGLPHMLDVPVSYLSAGMRKRVAFARLLIVQRPIWLLDEPTSALDTATVEQLGHLMQAHLAAGGLILAATHLPLPGLVQDTLEILPAASTGAIAVPMAGDVGAYL